VGKPASQHVEIHACMASLMTLSMASVPILRSQNPRHQVVAESVQTTGNKPAQFKCAITTTNQHLG
jgi:hypothetical protein